MEKSLKKGTKFTWDNRVWTVDEEIFEDNTDMRRCSSTQGDDTIFYLKFLDELKENGDLAVVKE